MWSVHQHKDLTWSSTPASSSHSALTGTDLAWLPDCSVPVLAVCSNEGYVQLRAWHAAVAECCALTQLRLAPICPFHEIMSAWKLLSVQMSVSSTQVDVIA